MWSFISCKSTEGGNCRPCDYWYARTYQLCWAISTAARVVNIMRSEPFSVAVLLSLFGVQSLRRYGQSISLLCGSLLVVFIPEE